MTRYFIGLMVPSGIRERLYAFAQGIGSKLSKDHTSQPAWNDPSDLHCTLLYIGEYPTESNLADQMEQVAAQLSPTEVTVVGPTQWLGRNSLAVQATGADLAGTTFMSQLGHLSSNAWAGRRPFYGHVTLGRIRPVPDPEDDVFAGHIVPALTWTADQVELFRNREAKSGPRYEVVAQAPFGDQSRR